MSTAPVAQFASTAQMQRADEFCRKNYLPVPPWLALCEWSKRGPLSNLHNAMLALEGDADFKASLGYDQMRCTAVVIAPIPGVIEAGDFPVALDDQMIVLVQRSLQRKALFQMSVATTKDAVEARAHANSYHPVRDWLATLPWDNRGRLADWLHTYLGAPYTDPDQTEYYKTIGSCFLTGMVARVMHPGCKMDYMLTLEGPQGSLKSQACTVLGGDYFSDHLPDLSGDPVRLCMHLRGKWLIEVSELSAFRAADDARLKAFLTRPGEEYTPKYGRKEVSEPRQCVLIATTNTNDYVLDDTGGRRYWPVECGTIDIDALRRDRDQLFAEAFHYFSQGSQWWPDPAFEAKYVKPMQEERQRRDIWDEPVADYLAQGHTEVTMMQVAASLGMLDREVDVPRQRRLAGCMRRAGWHPGKGTNGKRRWLR